MKARTTAVAVSVTVIVVAAVVIATVAGIWWFRKRKRQREAEAYDGGFLDFVPDLTASDDSSRRSVHAATRLVMCVS